MRLSIDGKDDEVESFEKLHEGDQVEVTYYQGKYFMDDFGDEDKDLFTANYFEQYPPLRNFFKGADGKQVVAIRGGWPEGDSAQQETDNMPAFIRREKEWPKDPRPTKDKIWYAQEDLWIQRELLRVIQQANRYASVFHGQGGTEENQTFVFTNPVWKIEVKRQGNHFTGTLTNISRQVQKLNVPFVLQLTNERRPFVKKVQVDGEPRRPKEQAKIDWQIEGPQVEGLFSVEQALTFETAPVKQLEDMLLDRHSHRTFPKGFKAWHGMPKKVKADPKQTTGTNQQMGPDPKAGMKPPDDLGPRRGGGRRDKKDSDERYSESTEQFRKLPVAMVLLVDQDSVHYVLAAFEESKLRFQVTQVTLTRYPDKLQDPRRAAKKGKDKEKRKEPTRQDRRSPLSGGEATIGGGMSMRPKNLPGLGRSMMYNPSVVIRQSPPGQESLSGGYVGEQGAIMELGVYGYATLYERFPPKNPAARLAKTITGGGPN
jgi:hypothetical protein